MHTYFFLVCRLGSLGLFLFLLGFFLGLQLLLLVLPRLQRVGAHERILGVGAAAT